MKSLTKLDAFFDFWIVQHSDGSIIKFIRVMNYLFSAYFCGFSSANIDFSPHSFNKDEAFAPNQNY